MGHFTKAKEQLFAGEGLATAAGLSLVLLSAASYRQNTLDGIYPVEVSLIVRHVFAFVAALAVFVFLRTDKNRRFLDSHSRLLYCVFAALLTACMGAKYSASLFIGTNGVVVLLGKIFEEFCSTLLVFLWASRILPKGFQSTIACFGSAVLMQAFFQFVLSFFQRVPCMVTLTLVPLVSVALFLHVLGAERKESAECPDGPIASQETQFLDLPGSLEFPALLGIVLCLSVIVGQILHPSLPVQGLAMSSQLSIALGYAAAGVLILVMLEYSGSSRQVRSLIAPFFLGVFAFITIAFALSSSLNNFTVAIYLMLASAVWQLASLIVWALPFSKTRHELEPLQIFALAQAAIVSGRIVSTIGMVAFGDAAGPFGAIILAILFIMSGFIVMKAFGTVADVRAEDASAAVTLENEVPEDFQSGSAERAHPATPFKTAIASIEESYGLTDQQGVVLELLAKGMNAKRISDELTVSLNTAKSHMRVIYSKMGIHSQQELLEIVDAEVKKTR